MKMLHGIVLGVVSVLLGVGIGAGVFFVNHETVSGAQSIIYNMKERLVEVDSVAIDVGIESQFQGAVFQFMGVPADNVNQMQLTGEIGFSDQANGTEVHANVFRHWMTDAQEAPFFILNTRHINNETYLRLNHVSDQVAVRPRHLLSALKQKWVLHPHTKHTDVQAWRQLLLKESLIVPVGQHVETSMDDTVVYRLPFVLNKDVFLSLAEPFFAGDAKKRLREYITSTDDIHGSLWVNQETFYPERVTLTAHIDGNLGRVGVFGGIPRYNGETMADIRFSQFNEPVFIDAPDDAHTPTEIFQLMIREGKRSVKNE